MTPEGLFAPLLTPDAANESFARNAGSGGVLVKNAGVAKMAEIARLNKLRW